jgi:trimeric autotransporter adhesin
MDSMRALFSMHRSRANASIRRYERKQDSTMTKPQSPAVRPVKLALNKRTLQQPKRNARHTIALAVSALAAIMAGAVQAAPANSFASGLLGGTGLLSNCISSTSLVLTQGLSNCDGGGLIGAGFASFDALGGLGAYSITTDSDTVHIGAGGMDRLTINTTNGINAFATLSLNSNKITNLAPGSITPTSGDAINGKQVYLLSTGISTSIDSLSTSTSLSLNSLSTGVATLSTSVGGLSTSVISLSTSVDSLSTAVNDSVRYSDPAHTAVIFGDPLASQVTLSNVANGAVGATSTEAINGAQLFGLASSTAAALGGNSTVNADGSITAPVYTFLSGSTFNSVDGALTNLDERVTQNTGDISIINTELSTIISGGGTKYFRANSTLADSSATGVESVAIGGNAQASYDNSVAIGSNSVTSAPNAVSVGAPGAERRIMNVAAGENDTDAVNYSQLKAVSNMTANAVTYDDVIHKSVTFGDSEVSPVTLKNVASGEVSATSTQAINGSQLYGVAANTAAALGGESTVSADGIISTKYTFEDGRSFTSVGGALTDLDGRVTQNTSDITAINQTLNTINTGGGITYFHANSTLADSSAAGAESVAIGGNAQASANNAVALGSNSIADRVGTVSVGARGAERQITNVAAGTQDTDAVNVSQLKSAGVINGDGTSNAVVTYDHNPDGSPNYASITLGDGISGTALHNVAAGISGADAVNVAQLNAAIGAVTNIAVNGGNPLFSADGDRNTEVANATGVHAVAMGANALASADNSVAIGANSVADRVNTVSVGAAGSERQITNVADGTQSTDAVNVRQLNMAAAQSQSYTDARISGVQGQINDVAGKAWGGIASAMAVAGLPQPTAPGKTMVAVAGSRFAGATGAAVGMSYVSNDARWVVKLSGNTSSYGSVGVVFGSGYQW